MRASCSEDMLVGVGGLDGLYEWKDRLEVGVQGSQAELEAFTWTSRDLAVYLLVV